LIKLPQIQVPVQTLQESKKVTKVAIRNKKACKMTLYFVKDVKGLPPPKHFDFQLLFVDLDNNKHQFSIPCKEWGVLIERIGYTPIDYCQTIFDSLTAGFELSPILLLQKNK